MGARKRHVCAKRPERFGHERLRLDVRDHAERLLPTLLRLPRVAPSNPGDRPQDREMESVPHLIGILDRVVQPIDEHGDDDAEHDTEQRGDQHGTLAMRRDRNLGRHGGVDDTDAPRLGRLTDA